MNLVVGKKRNQPRKHCMNEQEPTLKVKETQSGQSNERMKLVYSISTWYQRIQERINYLNLYPTSKTDSLITIKFLV